MISINKNILDKETLEPELITRATFSYFSRSIKFRSANKDELGNSMRINDNMAVYDRTLMVGLDDKLSSRIKVSSVQFEVKKERLAHAS